MKLHTSILVALSLLICGCAQNRSVQTDGKRNLRRETVEVHQAFAPDGRIVQLTKRTVTVERETTEAQEVGRVETEAPQFFDDAGQLIKNGAKAVAKATFGPAGEMAVDWTWKLIAGVAGLGTAAGAGTVIRERVKRRRIEEERDEYDTTLTQVTDGIEKAKENLAPEVVDVIHNSLSKSMDRSSKDRVRSAKAKV